MYDTAALKMSLIDREAAFNQAVAGVMPNKGINLGFVMDAIEFAKHELLALRRGTRQKNLSLEKIKAIEIPVPPVDEQNRVHVEIRNRKVMASQLRELYLRKLALLNELRASVLAAAFAGLLP